MTDTLEDKIYRAYQLGFGQGQASAETSAQLDDLVDSDTLFELEDGDDSEIGSAAFRRMMELYDAEADGEPIKNEPEYDTHNFGITVKGTLSTHTVDNLEIVLQDHIQKIVFRYGNTFEADVEYVESYFRDES